MRTYKRETLIKMYVASLVISIGLLIFIFCLYSKFMTGSMTLALGLIMPAGLIVFTIEICGFILNWKKILKGFIAPIPFLSYIIQWFVGS